jgi:hypothetical protein
MSPISGKDKRPRIGPSPAAAYIGELTKELARLARAEGCETLAYMLDIAAIEAEVMGGVPEGCRPS